MLQTNTERVLAGCVLILLSPLLFIVACVVILDSPGYPFFVQKRVGKDGKLFTIFKFRTMRGVDKETQGDGITRHRNNRHRITFVGRILRKYGLDESLQLINIIRGEMRFVGPRPSPPDQVRREIYTPLIKSVSPGLTGIIHTLPRTRHRHTQKIRAIERAYEDQRTFCSDVWILGRTLRILASGKHE